MEPEITAAAQQLKTFIEAIPEGTPTAIYFDDDADGICSGVLLDKLMGQKKFPILARLHYETGWEPFSEKFNEAIERKKIGLLIFTDFNITGFGYLEQYKAFIQRFPDLKIIILDHHTDTSVYSIDDTKILYINSSVIQKKIEGSQYCCSKLNYDLVTYIDPTLKKYDWISAIGIIGDMNQSTWGSFIKKIIDEENRSKNKDWIIPTDNEDYYLTPYGKVSSYIMYGAAKDDREAGTIYNQVNNSANVEDLVKKLIIYDPIKREIYDYVENYDYFLKNTKLPEDQMQIVEVEIKSNHNIGAIISNILSRQHPKVIFLVFQDKEDGHTYVHARLQEGPVNMMNLMVLAKKFSGNGGGHKQASGARVETANFKAFKTAIFEAIENS